MLYILIVVFHIGTGGTTATAIFNGRAACAAALAISKLKQRGRRTSQSQAAIPKAQAPKGPQGPEQTNNPQKPKPKPRPPPPSPAGWLGLPCGVEDAVQFWLCAIRGNRA